jgi:hypothetical protein
MSTLAVSSPKREKNRSSWFDSHSKHCRLEEGGVRGTACFPVQPHWPRCRLPGACEMGPKDGGRLGCEFNDSWWIL